MANLVDGQTYKLTVKSVTAAAAFKVDTNDANKRYFFHQFILTDEFGIEFVTQMSDLNPTQAYATKGDMIEVLVKSFTKGIYNVKYVRTVSVAKQALQGAKSLNPQVIGSAAAVALGYAVEFYRYTELKDGNTVLAKADEYFEWLTNKANL